MARHCAVWVPIWSAVAAAPTDRTRADPTRDGDDVTHSSARMPPIEPPTTAAQRRTPSRWDSSDSTATWSATVMRGKRDP